MNLELLGHRLVDFEAATEKRHADFEQEQKRQDAMITRLGEILIQTDTTAQHIDEKVDSLADSTLKLMTAISAQQMRIEALDRKAS